MNRKRSLLTVISLVCISACICFSIKLFRHRLKEYEFTNGLNQTESFVKEAAAMENKKQRAQNEISNREMEDKVELQETMKDYPAETVIDTSGIDATDLKDLFYSSVITEDIKKRITGKSYSKSCDVPFSELRYIRVLYLGFDKKTHIGELIVNKFIEKDTLDIFKELYFAGYPIEKMVLIDEYEADDIASMEEDNSSAFNYRFIDSTTKLSNHSYGLAIDINPRYNPYVREMGGKTVVLPANGLDYTDRNKDCEYYIKSGDLCYQAFIKRGFTWGGDWINQKDYQHFQKELKQ